MGISLRLFTSLALAALLAAPSPAEEWARFRGPNGSGISPSSGIPTEFGPTTNLEWKREIPFARSSPVVSGHSIYLTAIDKGAFQTLALDRETGATRWRQSVLRDRAADMYNGTDSATPSPVTDGSSVYVFFQETGLVAYSDSGEERWRRPLGPFRNFYGIAASPILAGDKLILLCDQVRDSFLLAVDKNSGEVLWRRDRPARVESYSTPVLYPNSTSPRQVLVAGSRWVDAYEVDSGQSVWALAGVGIGPVSSPVLAGDLLIVNAPDQAPEPSPPFTDLLDKHDSNGDGLLTLVEVDGTWMVNHFGFIDYDGDGRLSAEDWDTITSLMEDDNWGLIGIRLGAADTVPEILWRSQKSVAYIPTTIVYDGILYMVKDGIVTSFDPVSGEMHKRGRLTKGSPKVYASPVAADGKLYIATLPGEVAVLEAGRDWRVLALNDLGDEIYATPAILDGRIFIRTKGSLFSFASREESPLTDAPASQGPEISATDRGPGRDDDTVVDGRD